MLYVIRWGGAHPPPQYNGRDNTSDKVHIYPLQIWDTLQLHGWGDLKIDKIAVWVAWSIRGLQLHMGVDEGGVICSQNVCALHKIFFRTVIDFFVMESSTVTGICKK